MPVHNGLNVGIPGRVCHPLMFNQFIYKSMKIKDSFPGYYPGILNKIFLIMRISMLLICVFTFNVTATSVFSQGSKFTFDAHNKTVRDVLKQIESQSDIRFFYNDGFLDLNKKVEMNVDDMSVGDILNNLTAGTNLMYRVLENNLIVIAPRESAQQNVITGKVTDASSGEPLPGVNIVIKGTTIGTTSDINGKFTISVPNQDAVLVFSFVGYVTAEIPVAGKNTLEVALEQEVQKLDEVVVVGYGTTKRVTLTGSVSSVQGDELKQSPSTNFSNTLIGRVPGLVAITQSGEPGYDGAVIRIRGANTLGNNDPLIVIDGIPHRNMERLDPADIESFTVLKDASAAIYGTQAANGVILITTKRGQTGKPKITINVNGGFNQPTRIPDMADAATYATMLNEIAYYKSPANGRFQVYTQDDIDLFRNGKDPWGHPNTDWFHTVFKPWSNQNYENVSISGGTESMKYFISLGNKFEDGYYHHSATYYSQQDFRSNIDGKISQNIDVSFDVSGRQENRNFPTRSAGAIFRMLMRGKPQMPAFWPNGMPGPDIEYGDNPAVTSTDATGYDRDKRYILESNLRMNVRIPWVKGLSVQGNASFDKAFRYQKRFETPWYLYSWDGKTYDANGVPVLIKGKRGLDAPQLTQQAEDGQQITYNLFATYEFSSGDNNFKVMAGTESQKGIFNWFNAFRKNYVTSLIDQLFAGATDQYMSNNGSASQSAHRSYFGRVNYDYAQKYLAEFVLRYDGSYMFEKQYGFFPGISLGWRISEESFWKDYISFFDDFKLRASWGQTGNDRIYYDGALQEYKYLALYGFIANRSYVFGVSNDNKLLYERAVPNPNVTWEVANQSNIGFNATFLDTHMTLEADYFYNLRTNILWRRNASVPSTAGMSLPPENIGKVSNKGFEFILGYRGSAGDFRYTLSLNGSYAKNKIVFWDETPGIPEYQKSTGRPMGSSLYYEAIGVFKDQAAVDAYPHWAGARPGDIIFKDVNDDGVIDGLDRVMNEKSSLPRFVGGFSASLGYKNWDLSMLIQGAAGAVVYINPESGEIGNFYEEYAKNRWTPEHQSTTYPRAWNRDNEYWRSQANTFWLRPTDYIRLKNLEIGYTLPAKINTRFGIQSLRIYANGFNLLTLDKVKLIDPEVTAGTSYPLQRIVNLGLTLTF
jgi:TonB-linked SusC/RagA family outer membrane protein